MEDNFLSILVIIKKERLAKRASKDTVQDSAVECTVRRTQLCRSEMPVNDAMRRYNAPDSSFLSPACQFYAIETPS
ncbi:hypothetical protein EVAR_90328_1 [Eumeta japonica]|uniref:Uncharacterized protein n=1 Tax=Eumeta variegata TaxID=151549 RepID=A0A4C1YKJ2_EUMVA|nr:hypothetical protein EVAR_90328_1 [Eumeta japonica]